LNSLNEFLSFQSKENASDEGVLEVLLSEQPAEHVQILYSLLEVLVHEAVEVLLEFGEEVLGEVECLVSVLQLAQDGLDPVEVRLALSAHHYDRIQDFVSLLACRLSEVFVGWVVFVVARRALFVLFVADVVAEDEDQFVIVLFYDGRFQEGLDREPIQEVVQLHIISVVGFQILP
jgi:hypothetical protein